MNWDCATTLQLVAVGKRSRGISTVHSTCWTSRQELQPLSKSAAIARNISRNCSDRSVYCERHIGVCAHFVTDCVGGRRDIRDVLADAHRKQRDRVVTGLRQKDLPRVRRKSRDASRHVLYLHHVIFTDRLVTCERARRRRRDTSERLLQHRA